MFCRPILSLLSGVLFAAAPMADRGAQASDWKDPYPAMPAKNDKAFIGKKWRAGPMIGANRLDYLVQTPAGNTAAAPLIVIGAAGDDTLTTHRPLYEKAVVVFIGASSTAEAGAVHNGWLMEEINRGEGEECSPVCPAWKFIPATAIREVLTDVARHVRFAHNRVQMFATNDARYGVYRALDPVLQPYFAGVAHGVYAEWQQADCPDAPTPTSAPPAMFFSWGGCDASFCPTAACMRALESKGYTIEPSSGGDAAPAACPCPAGERTHMIAASDRVRKATYDWLLSNARR